MTRVSLPLPVLILQTSVIGPSLSLAASFAPIRDQRAPVSSFALKRFHVLPFSRRIRTYSHRPSIFISLPRHERTSGRRFARAILVDAEIFIHTAICSYSIGRENRSLRRRRYSWPTLSIALLPTTIRRVTSLGGRPERIFKKLANRFAEAGTR